MTLADSPLHDACLDEVRDLQAAFLNVLDSDLTPAAKETAARRLLVAAREHPVPSFAVSALACVLDRHVAELTEVAPIGDRLGRQMLRMLSRGERTCSRCLRQLPDEETIRYWAQEAHLAASWRDHLRGVT